MDNGMIPKIRFRGFTDAWEQRKLEDYINVSRSKNKDEQYDKEDVLSVSGDFGIINQIELQGRSFAGESVANYGVVETGDIVYTKSPLKSNPYGIIKANKGATGIVSTLYAVYKPKEFTDSEFVQVYFEQNTRINNYMKPLVNKGAKNDMKVSDENALKGEVIFPGLEEQKMISKIFRVLDNLIALHQRKLDRLKQMKQGYLQKMFPRNGESVPRLRFTDFEGKWEQRKLGEICKVNSGRDYKHLNEGNIPVYGTGGYMLSVDDKLSDIDGIGIGRKGTIDNPQYLKAPFWTVDTLFYMTSMPNNDLKFLFSLSQNIGWKKMDESTGVPSLSKSSIEKINCSYPSMEEQQKIGAFFDLIDKTIIFQQAQLDKFKLLKKAYLQKMFT
ncbi:restriction endonuclease subunit S [Anaerocolumna sp.]|uniref:restriction endonuclease subunit S n=1 Tax=Anaerocolumna sp. TaxID=2041569 RepID=UPI0028AEE7D5|nr:restriction endonuclease subunit S [Anaerocolumna sp.]